ncbi:MAG TPA: type II secretion system protein GspJ [Dissulfurispiraceae bacterium]|nr:type II secretion system protein GspJ [Dissulfurispiraceae bacterium]
MRKETAARDRGFTLLEVLLSIALLAVVITVLYSTFFLSRRAVDAVDDSLLRLQECRSALDLMRREMESAYLRDGDEKYTLFKIEDRDFFGRQTSQVTFTSFTPQATGLAKITYRIDEEDGQLMLTKKIVSPFSRTEEPQAVPLIEDVESFTVEVRFNDRWVRTWDTAVTKKTPQEIRISLGVPLKRQGGLSGDARQAAVYRIAETVQPRRGRVP